MATTVRIPVNGQAMAWARGALQLTPEVVAKAANIKPSVLLDIEAGNTQPTYAQAKKLAHRLERSIGFLMVPPPEIMDVPDAVDYRDKGNEELPDALRRELKRCREYRDAMVELGEAQPVKRIPPITWDNYEDRATEFRTALGINSNFIPPKGSDARAIFNFWRDIIESAGYLIFQATAIDLTAFKGLSVDDDRIPFILLNGADYPTSKIFTIFHEICHLANATNALCLLKEKVHQEALANRFAAAVLMPASEILSMDLRDHSPEDASFEVAKRFRVSTLSAAIRLKHLGFMSEDELQLLWQSSDTEWAEKRRRDKEEREKRENKGFNSWILKYRDLGPRYVGALARAYEDERINLIDLTYLMHTRIPTVENVLNAYYVQGGDAE